eukprot:COSAG05_NODE_571_length_8620_cov_4.012440_4_plen_1324_part_01
MGEDAFLLWHQVMRNHKHTFTRLYDATSREFTDENSQHKDLLLENDRPQFFITHKDQETVSAQYKNQPMGERPRPETAKQTADREAKEATIKEQRETARKDRKDEQEANKKHEEADQYVEAIRQEYEEHVKAVAQSREKIIASKFPKVPFKQGGDGAKHHKSTIQDMVETACIVRIADEALAKCQAVWNDFAETTRERHTKETLMLQYTSGFSSPENMKKYLEYRWNSQHYLWVFKLKWPDLAKKQCGGNVELGLEPQKTTTLQEAVKSVMGHHGRPDSHGKGDHDPEEQWEKDWDALSHVMEKESVMEEDERKAQKGLVRARFEAFAALETEIQEVMRYIRSEERTIAEIVGQSATEEQEQRDALVDKQAHELWQTWQRVDWKKLETEEAKRELPLVDPKNPGLGHKTWSNPVHRASLLAEDKANRNNKHQQNESEMLGVLRDLGYNRELWHKTRNNGGRQYAHGTFAFKDWDHLGISMQERLEQLVIIPNATRDQATSFSMRHWNVLYHAKSSKTHASTKEARDNVKQQHNAFVEKFFDNDVFDEKEIEKSQKLSASAAESMQVEADKEKKLETDKEKKARIKREKKQREQAQKDQKKKNKKKDKRSLAKRIADGIQSATGLGAEADADAEKQAQLEAKHRKACREAAKTLGYENSKTGPADWDNSKLLPDMYIQWDHLTEKQQSAATLLLVGPESETDILKREQKEEQVRLKMEKAQKEAKERQDRMDQLALSTNLQHQFQDPTPEEDEDEDDDFLGDNEREQKAKDMWYYISFGSEAQDHRDEREEAAELNEQRRLSDTARRHQEKALQAAQLWMKELQEQHVYDYAKITRSEDYKDAKFADDVNKKIHVQLRDEGGLCLVDPTVTHLRRLGIYIEALQDKINRDGRVHLFMLQPRTIDEVWDGRLQKDQNKHEALISFRALFAKILRTIGLPPLPLHQIYRFWHELNTDQRSAAVSLGYSAASWDDQVEEISPRIFRTTQSEIDVNKTISNPLVKWYHQGSVVGFIGRDLLKRWSLSDGRTSLRTIITGLFIQPFAAVAISIEDAFEGDRDKYKFLVGPYTAECYYWELVEYLRKFIMSGAMIFVAPGSLSQVFVGASIAVGYLLLVARMMPYRDPQTNRTKLLAEAALSVVFLCTLAMRAPLAGEFLTTNTYANIMLYAVLLGAILPSLVNAWTAALAYVTQLNQLQESLVKGGTVKEKKSRRHPCAPCARFGTAFLRLLKRFYKLYVFASQLGDSFEQMDDTVTNGAEDEGEDEDDSYDGAMKEANMEDMDTAAVASSGGGSDMPEKLYEVKGNGQIAPKRVADLTAEAVRGLVLLG